MAREWRLNLINLLPEKTVAEQEAEHGLLYQSAPDRCCGCARSSRSSKPWRSTVSGSPACGASRHAPARRLKKSALFPLPNGKQVLKLAPLAAWTTRDVWYACQQLAIPLLPLYDRGYSSIGCEPCTSLPTDPNDPRSGPLGGAQSGVRHSHSSGSELAQESGADQELTTAN